MLPTLISPFLSGFVLGASLIIAIGAQNAYVLRLGLLRLHVLPVVLICAVSDAVLVVLGIAGLGTLIQGYQTLLLGISLGGALFLFVYGLIAFRRAMNPESMSVSTENSVSLTKAVTTVLAFTFLNPHVYLDTVLLLGGLSARFEGVGQLAYGAGAVTASFVWFFLLGYGARLLAPLFSRPSAWRVLDVLIGLVMWAIAFVLVSDVLKSGV